MNSETWLVEHHGSTYVAQQVAPGVLAEAALAVLEHVPGRGLAGASPLEQQRIARTLAGVHAAVDRRRGPGTSGFFDRLGPESPGVGEHPWLAPAIMTVRA